MFLKALLSLRRVVYSVLFVSLCFCAESFAQETYQLYSRGRPHKNFNRIVENLEVGDSIRFSNGSEFKIQALLDERSPGMRSRILQVSDDQAIRIRKRKRTFWPQIRAGIFFDFTDSTCDLEDMWGGYKTLRENGVPVTKIFTEQSDPNEFLLVEKLNIRFFWSQFMSDGFLEQFDGETYERLVQATQEFARATAMFMKIGDLNGRQIVYSTTKRNPIPKWRILDWDPNHQLLRTSDLRDAVSNIFLHDEWATVHNRMIGMSPVKEKPVFRIGLPESIEEEVIDSVTLERAKIMRNRLARDSNQTEASYFGVDRDEEPRNRLRETSDQCAKSFETLN